MTKQFLTFILLFTISMTSMAQKPEYEVLFHGIGDNREFTQKYSYPQTIMGERTSIELGTTIDSLHRFRFGLSHLFEFGTEADQVKPKLTAYYRYNDQTNTFFFGAFPRMDLLDFPLAMLADTFLYYRPNIEGLFGKHSWSWGHQLGFVDWTSRQTMTQRETFMAGLSGEMRFNLFYFQNYLLLYHHALTAAENADEHISDNMGYALYLGYNFQQLTGLQKAYLKVGVLGSSIRERNVDDGYTTGTSLSGQLYGEGKRFALRSTFSFGEGHQLMNGDPYYAQDSYLRTDVIWKFLQYNNIQGTFNLSFHLVDGSTLDQQQQLSLVYRFGNAN
ncbi:hypothetical protein [Mangrovibacterium sp.]|uniref:hypothetical protein n=1 Tax=Mangrovibacterium sp. TaxID=1961364 RepID=UPI00356A6C41